MNSFKLIHCFLPKQSKRFLSFTCNSLFKHLKDVRESKTLHTEVFKVQYIIIQAILSRKSMKIFAVTDEKIFRGF